MFDFIEYADSNLAKVEVASSNLVSRSIYLHLQVNQIVTMTLLDSNLYKRESGCSENTRFPSRLKVGVALPTTQNTLHTVSHFAFPLRV